MNSTEVRALLSALVDESTVSLMMPPSEVGRFVRRLSVLKSREGVSGRLSHSIEEVDDEADVCVIISLIPSSTIRVVKVGL